MLCLHKSFITEASEYLQMDLNSNLYKYILQNVPHTDLSHTF